MKQYPSIFNDVIGPVMIGHSSSHTAASVRIGNVIRQIVGGDVKKIKFSFDSESSLATTYKSQGSDIGLIAGILGFETYDKRLPHAYKYLEEAKIDCVFEVKNLGAGHPNAYYIEFTDCQNKPYTLTALSVGGGMFEITNYMGFEVSIDGGSAVTLDFPGLEVKKLNPVLPVMSQVNPSVPFITAKEISKYAKIHNMSFSELAILYESERSGLSSDAVLNKMCDIVDILKKSIETPSDDFVADRILTNQSHLIEESNALGGSFSKNIIKYVTRFMDIKTSMGVFVAAPTAGSCGCVPGCAFAIQKELNLSDEQVTRALLSAGLIGVLIAHHSTFAAEVCGCQSECGAGSGMAAAMTSEILGGSVDTCLAAASMALQNIMGLICDPVGNKVEVPCLGKNILAALNAIASANMAAAGFDAVIPLDETIDALDRVGKSIPRELRCTGLGGLSVTDTSKEILQKFEGGGLDANFK